MQFDPDRNVYVDLETGAVIPIEDGDDLHDIKLSITNETTMNGNVTAVHGDVEMGRIDTNVDDQWDADRRYAEALQQEEIGQHNAYNNNTNAAPQITRYITASIVKKPKTKNSSSLFRELTTIGRNQHKTSRSASDLIPEMHHSELGVDVNEEETNRRMHDGTADDWSLARAMQLTEIEYDNEVYRAQGGDFVDKEVRGSSCWRQMKTISTCICLLQIIVLILTIRDDGYAPASVNPMYGPYPTTLVRWGAKDAALIRFRNEWWRVFSPIMLHAGIIHLFSNVMIQLRVGGYLNLVFGNVNWLLIYILSGVYGNMLSCVMLTDSIGVGSSGALLGILSAWITFIVFRWKKIPENNRSQRNCQLLIATGAVSATLAMSFSSLVDYAAHFGGALQGFLWGMILLSHELDNETTRLWIRISAFVVSMTLFGFTLSYMLNEMNPSKEFFPLFDANDDWKKYPHNGPEEASS